MLIILPSSSARPAPQGDLTDNLLAPWAVAVGIPALSAAAVATVMVAVISEYAVVEEYELTVNISAPINYLTGNATPSKRRGNEKVFRTDQTQYRTDKIYGYEY